MKTAIISTEIVCSIMMFIVGYAIFTEKRKELSHHFFNGCIISVIIILLSDAFSYILDGNQSLYHLTYITNFLALVVGDLLIAFFSLYVWSIVNENNQRGRYNKYFLFTVSAIVILDFVFEIYGAISKATFSIVDYYFVPGPLYDYCFVIQLIVLTIIIIYLVLNISVIGKKTLLIFGVYFFFPIISMILIIINPDYSFICSSIAMSFFVIYIGIEKERESRNYLLSELIKIDILTGLKNRNAYEEKLNSCKDDNADKKIGIIFCDLNRLKEINDDYGHAAGDQYIIKFSNILKEQFTNNDVFRISGDEFVVMVENEDRKTFKSLYKNINDILIRENNIASCGMDYGKETDVINIIRNAEKNMYIDKQEFYLKNNINRRRT